MSKITSRVEKHKKWWSLSAIPIFWFSRISPQNLGQICPILTFRNLKRGKYSLSTLYNMKGNKNEQMSPQNQRKNKKNFIGWKGRPGGSEFIWKTRVRKFHATVPLNSGMARFQVRILHYRKNRYNYNDNYYHCLFSNTCIVKRKQ